MATVGNPALLEAIKAVLMQPTTPQGMVQEDQPWSYANNLAQRYHNIADYQDAREANAPVLAALMQQQAQEEAAKNQTEITKAAIGQYKDIFGNQGNLAPTDMSPALFAALLQPSTPQDTLDRADTFQQASVAGNVINDLGGLKGTADAGLRVQPADLNNRLLASLVVPRNMGGSGGGSGGSDGGVKITYGSSGFDAMGNELNKLQVSGKDLKLVQQAARDAGMKVDAEPPKQGSGTLPSLTEGQNLAVTNAREKNKGKTITVRPNPNGTATVLVNDKPVRVIDAQGNTVGK